MKSDRPMELLQQSVLIFGLALAFSFSVVYFACETANSCVEDGTCQRINSESSTYLPQCSFKRIPGLMGSLEYIESSSNANSTLESSLRAYCAPGERLQTFTTSSFVDHDEDSSNRQDDIGCTPQYPYPNALSTEIQDFTQDSHSKKMCGAWMDAGHVGDPFGAYYWSFSGLEQEVQAVREGSLASVSSSLSRTNIGKMYEKCTHTALSGEVSILYSAKDAYQYLVSESKLEHVNDSDSALRSLGVLIGHYCDGPVTIGWTYSQNTAFPGAFSATMYEGVRFSDTAVGEAMQLVGEEKDVIQKAVDANVQINSIADQSIGFPDLETMEKVYEGASSRTDHSNVSLVYGIAPELTGFQTISNSKSINSSISYLKAIAATCSFVVSDSLSNTGYTVLPSWSAAQRDLGARRDAKVSISALGRLEHGSKDKNHFEPMKEMDNKTMHNATSATLSQLVSSSFVDEQTQCASYVTSLFPDTLDSERFSMVFTGDIYSKLESVVRRVRRGVVNVLREDERIRRILSDSDRVAEDVERVRIRIPGAPRGTWAGADRNSPYAFFQSDDSFFKMALKQARAVFLDRQSHLVYEATDVCEGPAAMDSLTANAYIYPSVQCSYYLLGLSLRPFLDNSFDEESLIARFGYIVAHELSHSTLNVQWDTNELESLLHRYESNTYSEAIADVLAGLGIMRSNNDSAYKMTSQELCNHVAQIWCARTGSLYYMTSYGVHPKANRRGDYFCETLITDSAM